MIMNDLEKKSTEEGVSKLALEAKFDDFCAGPVSAQIDIFD